MGEVSNIRKLEILIIQLFPIYVLSFVLASHELLVFLMVVHTISYYVSGYSKISNFGGGRRTDTDNKARIGLSFVSCCCFSIIRTHLYIILSIYNLLWIVG